jgi:hypothetical protein
MPKTISTAINSLNPKAQLTQGPTSLVELLGASTSLPLSGLSLLLISLLSALALEIKNTLLPLGETAAASHLLKIEGYGSPRALNADGIKIGQSIFAFYQEAKQPFLPFDLEKRNKSRLGIDPGGSAPESKARS